MSRLLRPEVGEGELGDIFSLYSITDALEGVGIQEDSHSCGPLVCFWASLALRFAGDARAMKDHAGHSSPEATRAAVRSLFN